jgi:hypothetical protein
LGEVPWDYLMKSKAKFPWLKRKYSSACDDEDELTDNLDLDVASQLMHEHDDVVPSQQMEPLSAGEQAFIDGETNNSACLSVWVERIWGFLNALENFLLVMSDCVDNFQFFRTPQHTIFMFGVPSLVS